ncbi:hypothetical protein RMR16_024370 (plasmid) [Agrobacterium sp. rho-13.3]|uniref:hypothetical protein n=1 Tax=Agrobacterium sp. rho-13.3 TaxID=3072980 RepID=UPI002A0FED6E|nr:hypothetical protein [Agrobacterium sp. rho-13.3]MDX8311947.1 hypothetical protein [Agrobacterium sp. rho-13.3]
MIKALLTSLVLLSPGIADAQWKPLVAETCTQTDTTCCHPEDPQWLCELKLSGLGPIDGNGNGSGGIGSGQWELRRQYELYLRSLAEATKHNNPPLQPSLTLREPPLTRPQSLQPVPDAMDLLRTIERDNAKRNTAVVPGRRAASPREYWRNPAIQLRLNRSSVDALHNMGR